MIENVLENVWSGIINAKYETYYQPQYNNSTGEIIGLEALARLNDPDGVVSPSKFISVLERKGMINKLDSFIFESVCKFLKKCKEENGLLVPVSINLSRVDFEDDKFINKLEEIRKSYDVNPKLIAIEITEALAAENKNKAMDVIKEFHNYGYIVKLDNYHGGNFIIDTVKGIRYDVVKLDFRALNDDLTNNDGKQITQILDTIKKLNIPVMAEGVETLQQVEYLKSKNIDKVQGYYFAKPMSEKSIYNLLNGIDDFSDRQKQAETESYKRKFENLLEQVDIYYWEYVVATKEMYPCSRSIRDFDLNPIVYKCPKSILELGIVSSESENDYINIFKQIDNGTKHVEETIKLNNNTYIVRCDTEFDEHGMPTMAYCSATRIINS